MKTLVFNLSFVFLAAAVGCGPGGDSDIPGSAAASAAPNNGSGAAEAGPVSASQQTETTDQPLINGQTPTNAAATAPTPNVAPTVTTSGGVAASSISGTAMDLDGQVDFFALQLNVSGGGVFTLEKSASGLPGTFQVTEILQLVKVDSGVYSAFDRNCGHRERVKIFDSIVDDKEIENLATEDAGGAVAVFQDLKNDVLIEIRVVGNGQKTLVKEISCDARTGR